MRVSLLMKQPLSHHMEVLWVLPSSGTVGTFGTVMDPLGNVGAHGYEGPVGKLNH